MSYHDLEVLGVSGIIDVLALFSRIVEVFCKGFSRILAGC